MARRAGLVSRQPADITRNGCSPFSAERATPTSTNDDDDDDEYVPFAAAFVQINGIQAGSHKFVPFVLAAAAASLTDKKTRLVLYIPEGSAEVLRATPTSTTNDYDDDEYVPLKD
ncbi:unnamed protein product [Notodromas monacha]|uniref:Uncharacterized protein n=1 Tax=Notodromas monacha TaxID=399045 RepID=A0A7R9GFM8_9CRUS|nr:unnamed protein product [Notodromas monacha]CAG0919508.1 unnamed protein product [Notodromas monacha]